MRRLAGLDEGFGQLGGTALLRDSVNHVQAMVIFVSLWRSDGEDCQCHRRAEGKGTGDDDEKHDMYKSISNAAACRSRGCFSRIHDFGDEFKSFKNSHLQNYFQSHLQRLGLMPVAYKSQSNATPEWTE